MCFRTSFSRHFMVTDVSATGLKSFIMDIFAFLGTGSKREDLKIQGTISCESDVLKMSVYTCASCCAQALRTLGATRSGPAALWGFACLKTPRTWV